jgi:transcriptional regulator with XRE-family HTH domain
MKKAFSQKMLTQPPGCCNIITTDQKRFINMKPKAIFGNFFKTKRIEAGFTLREFCRTHSLDPGNISRMERGLLKPPSSKDKLEEYASYLGIEKGSDDWYEFFDLAAACRGEIPEEFLDDEELIKHLPIIFRTIRGKKVSKKKLEELIEMIRRA